MTTHVQIKEDILGRHLEVNVAKSHPDGSGVAYSFPCPTEFYVAAGTRADVFAIEPLRLEQDAARALYEALRKHFGAAPETASLRADFEHERTRVDKMIDAMLERP